MFEKLETLASSKKELDEKLIIEGKVAIEEAIKEFFDAYPKIEKLRWMQFTPYYNDEDPCYFSVQKIEVKLYQDKDKDESIKNKDDCDTKGWINGWGDEAKNEGIVESIVKLDDCFYWLEDVMRLVFGSDSRITVSREGIEIDECDHD